MYNIVEKIAWNRQRIRPLLDGETGLVDSRQWSAEITTKDLSIQSWHVKAKPGTKLTLNWFYSSTGGSSLQVANPQTRYFTQSQEIFHFAF